MAIITMRSQLLQYSGSGANASDTIAIIVPIAIYNAIAFIIIGCIAIINCWLVSLCASVTPLSPGHAWIGSLADPHHNLKR